MLQPLLNFSQRAEEGFSLRDELGDDRLQIGGIRRGSWCLLESWELEPGADAVGFAGVVEIPGDSGQGEGLQEPVNRAAGALEFFGQRADVPAAVPHDQMQQAQQPSQTLALANASIDIGTLFPGHHSPALFRNRRFLKKQRIEESRDGSGTPQIR